MNGLSVKWYDEQNITDIQTKNERENFDLTETIVKQKVLYKIQSLTIKTLTVIKTYIKKLIQKESINYDKINKQSIMK